MDMGVGDMGAGTWERVHRGVDMGAWTWVLVTWGAGNGYLDMGAQRFFSTALPMFLICVG